MNGFPLRTVLALIAVEGLWLWLLRYLSVIAVALLWASPISLRARAFVRQA
jgi:hypothetical protein